VGQITFRSHRTRLGLGSGLGLGLRLAVGRIFLVGIRSCCSDFILTDLNSRLSVLSLVRMWWLWHNVDESLAARWRLLIWTQFRRRSVRKPRKSTFSITPLSFDASSPRNAREFSRKPYIFRNYSHCATSLLLIVWAYLHSNFHRTLRSKTRVFWNSAKWPFKVNRGHWFRYQSKACMQIPTSRQ